MSFSGLTDLSEDAAKQWIFESASSESRELIVFVFTPPQ